MSFGWNLFQQLQLRSTEKYASDAKLQSKTNQNDIALLEEKLDALSLACHAMFKILQDKHGLTEEQLEAKIQELDLQDGVLDGKISIDVKTCPDCGHKLNKRHKNCFYCGAETNSTKLF